MWGRNRLRKRIIKVEDFPEIDTGKGKKSPLQDLIYEFIKKHPNCSRKDLYSLNLNDGSIRKSLTSMLKSNKVKETFTIM